MQTVAVTGRQADSTFGPLHPIRDILVGSAQHRALAVKPCSGREPRKEALVETSKKLVTSRWARGVALGLVLAACVPERASGPKDIEMMALTAAGTVKRLTVTNGYNSINNLTLVQDGSLFSLYAVDFDYVDLESGGSLNLDFGN